MRWDEQLLDTVDDGALPGLGASRGLLRTFEGPDFRSMQFLEIAARTALNRVPGTGFMGGSWTINPYRGCQHACVYCFARRTHTYLDLDAGGDFDTKVVVKVNVAEVLDRELRTRRQRPERVLLGTNTDPYQRAEGRYRLLPRIIATLARHGVGISILTKGTLLRRDLPLLAEVAETVPVQLSMSIAVFEEALQRSVEPGTPSAAARVATVRAVRDAGLDCAVLLMPVLPGLTDTVGHLERAFAELADAGASSVTAGALHLRPGARQWYLAWLAREHPHLVPLYQRLYAAGPNLAASYRRWLHQRIEPIRAAHGFGQSHGRPDRLIRPASQPPTTAPTPLF